MRCPAPNSVLRSVSSCQSDIKMPLCSGGLVQGRKVLSPAPELRPPVKAARISSDPLPFVPQSEHRRSSHSPSDAFAPPSRVSRDSFPKTEHRDQRVGAGLSDQSNEERSRSRRDPGPGPGPLRRVWGAAGHSVPSPSDAQATGLGSLLRAAGSSPSRIRVLRKHAPPQVPCSVTAHSLLRC